MTLIISIKLFTILISAGFVAGFVDSIAGGGGLITIPTFLLIGLSPHFTLGTNKLAATFGAINAARIFVKRKIVKPLLWQACLIATAIGAFFGVLINNLLTTTFLDRLLPIVILLVAVYVAVYRPDTNRDPSQHQCFRPPMAISATAGLILGFYDGCLGPGTGSFWTCAAMSLFKFDIVTASGVARVMNAVSNVTALLVFIFLQKVYFLYGILMGLGLLAGSHIGARSAIRFGANFIRPIFLTVVIAIAGHLAWTTW